MLQFCFPLITTVRHLYLSLVVGRYTVDAMTRALTAHAVAVAAFQIAHHLAAFAAVVTAWPTVCFAHQNFHGTES